MVLQRNERNEINEKDTWDLSTIYQLTRLGKKP